MKNEEISKIIEEIESELKELRTKLTQEKKYFDLSEIRDSTLDHSGSNGFICVRNTREYRNKAFYLNADLNWEIKKDSEGLLCLIPTKK